MGDFEEKLNAILSNPDAMAQVASLAQSLGGSPQPPEVGEVKRQPPPQQENTPPDLSAVSSLLGQVDPSVIQRFLPLMGEFNSPQDIQRRQFLQALRPYLRESRREKVDRALQIAKMLHLGKKFLGTLGDSHV